MNLKGNNMNIEKYEESTSIIIPSRKYDYLLENTIQKIRNLYKKINIVIILDDINFSKEKIPSDITVLKSKSLNMSAKRNQGVQCVNTKYVALLDSDAYPFPNWLETGIEFLNNNSNYSAVYGSWKNPENDSFEQLCTRIHRFMPLFARDEYTKIIGNDTIEQDSQIFISANVIIRREDYIKAGMMNEKLYIDEDIEFAQRMVKQGCKIRFIPDVKVFHRESKIFAYLRKTFCCGYYYANMRIKGNCQKELDSFENHFKNSGFWHLYPLTATITYILLWIIFLITKIPTYPLTLLAIFILFIILYNCIKATKHLEKYKIKGFFFLSYISILFCIIYVISTLFGLLNIQIKRTYDLFRQY